MIPQIIILVFFGISLLVHGIKDGKERVETYNFKFQLLEVLVYLILLHLGGYFKCFFE